MGNTVLSGTDLGHGTFHMRIMHEDANMGKYGYISPSNRGESRSVGG